MERVWSRQERAAVLAARRRGARPALATTLACGPLDDRVARPEEAGLLAALDELAVQRKRRRLADGLLVRPLATLPVLQDASWSGAAGARFRQPALLRQLGWAPAQMRAGDKGRPRHPAGRPAASLPCHPDTLRDELRRIEARRWARLQQIGVQALYARPLVRGPVSAIDGSGLGADLRLVVLVCVSGERPVIVAWRLLTGSASEQGKEAAVTKALHPAGPRQALALGGPGCSRLLLADGLYADGPLLAWLKDVHGIDALVRLPADRLLYQQRQQLAGLEGVAWAEHRYLRTIQGHQQPPVVAVASAGALTEWDSSRAAAAGYGQPAATRWACLIREVAPVAQPVAAAGALVSTRWWADGRAALQAYRPRWHIEHDADRALKAGWGLEEQHWGREVAAIRGRLTLTCLACNTAQG